MAWNVLILGGGFGGLNAARRLERTLPHHSANVTLVSDVNFMLYTPLLPGAAAGTLEPRHVVVPLREQLEHRAAPRHVPGADPDRKVSVRSAGGGEPELPYDQLLVALGSTSRTLPIPGLASTPRLQDAVRGDRAAQPAPPVDRAGRDRRGRGDPARAAHLRVRGRRLRGPRGARRAAGLLRGRPRPLPALRVAGPALRPRRGARPRDARDLRRPRRVRHRRAAPARDRDPHLDHGRADLRDSASSPTARSSRPARSPGRRA